MALIRTRPIFNGFGYVNRNQELPGWVWVGLAGHREFLPQSPDGKLALVGSCNSFGGKAGANFFLLFFFFSLSL